MADTAKLRQENLNMIRRILLGEQGFTKQEIAARTGLSQATCNTLLNVLARHGEVQSEQRRTGSVGRSSAVYRINEAYESFLCLHFELLEGIRRITLYRLSPLGKILTEAHAYPPLLDADTVTEFLRTSAGPMGNCSRILVGTPSLVDEGRIRHCDIPELEGVRLQQILEETFGLPVHMENDMHYRIFGYYRKELPRDSVITLLNFPSHILPGTATIHRGEFISGFSGLAGMTGFLPFDFDREELLRRLNPRECLPVIVKSTAALIAIVNPGTMVFTGDLMSQELTDQVYRQCLRHIPPEHMPQMIFREDIEEYYRWGMYQRALELNLEDHLRAKEF